jgi:hypothetical protein
MSFRHHTSVLRPLHPVKLRHVRHRLLQRLEPGVRVLQPVAAASAVVGSGVGLRPSAAARRARSMCLRDARTPSRGPRAASRIVSWPAGSSGSRPRLRTRAMHGCDEENALRCALVGHADNCAVLGR